MRLCQSSLLQLQNQQRKKAKMTLQEKRDLAISLAKEKYDEQWLAGLWGCASVLLSEKDFEVIISVMEK